MKRRGFITRSGVGAVGLGLTGCSGFGAKTVAVKKERTPFEPDRKVPKPKGTMPMGSIGKTGITVSKFGFGSHMTQEITAFTKEREWMVRESLDLGVNLFDVYDYEFGIYQYGPMGRYLKDVIRDVVISVAIWPFDGRTVEQQMERDLRLFGRDYIDLVRIYAWKNTTDEKVMNEQLGHRWEWWETLFRMKEKGYIRAIGVPVHVREDLKEPLENLPLDFVIVPYNFYHNWTYTPMAPDDWDATIKKLSAKGIGVISMKPFAGDDLVTPFKRLAAQYDPDGSVNFAKACLRYVFNSDMKFDATIGGMYSPYHIYENIDACFNPAMSDAERRLLDRIADTAKIVAKDLLSPEYRFLERWAGEWYCGSKSDCGRV